MKYTFIQEDGKGDKLVMEFTAYHLEKMLLQFRWFLQGCSFVIDVKDEVIVDASAKYNLSLFGGKKVKKK